MGEKTIQLDVHTSVPVKVAQEALAGRALTILERAILKAAKRAVDEFIANGVSAELEKVAVKSSKSTIGAS